VSVIIVAKRGPHMKLRVETSTLIFIFSCKTSKWICALQGVPSGKHIFKALSFLAAFESFASFLQFIVPLFFFGNVVSHFTLHHLNSAQYLPVPFTT
jgi:hypothetical protein